MRHNPILAAKTIPAGRDGYKVARTFRVQGGLHYIKSNGSPYFSLTYTSHRKGFPNQCWSGGAGHDKIEKHFPGRFTDLAALHLSDIDGAPMYGEANAWYDLAGYFGGMGEQYHVGNSERHFPITPPTDKPWKDTEYRKPTREECLAIFARHVRLPIEEARALADRLPPTPKEMRAALRQEIDAMRPRWKQEAQACIARHSLKVYGDEWQAAA